MRKSVITGISLTVWILLCGLTSFAQTPTTPSEPVPGTSRPVVPATGSRTDTTIKPRVLKSIFGTVATDSVPVSPNSSRQKVDLPAPTGDSIKVGGSVLSPGHPAGDSLAKGTDTLQLSARQNAAIHKIVPRKATLRALTFPGLGQAYNRQYYKIPFVYAGFGAITYFIIRYTGNYNDYVRGYREAYNLPALAAGQTTYSNGLTFKGAIVNGKSLGIPQLKQGSEFWRRNRDLNIILGVLLYGLQAVEANVAAHLKTFDISDDISANWKPMLLPSPGGLVAGVRLTFNFKH